MIDTDDNHEIARAAMRERSKTEGLVVDGVGGNCPVQGEGWIGGLPFFFRARHDSWSISISKTPDGDPIDVRFGKTPGWTRTRTWSCADLPDGDPGRNEDCDHIHCAGWMSNETAGALIEVAAQDFLSGVPSDEWCEPDTVTAVRELSAALSAGRLRIVEEPMGWFSLTHLECVPDSSDQEGDAQ